MRRLCATVLIFEVVVIGLAIPVAITIEHAKPAAAGVAGGVLAAAAGLACAMVIATGMASPITTTSKIRTVAHRRLTAMPPRWSHPALPRPARPRRRAGGAPHRRWSWTR